MKNNKTVTRYVFITLFIILMILSFFIIKPYLNAILGGIVLAIIFFPIYNWLKRRIRSRSVCALIVTILALMIIFIPVVLVFQQVSYQAKVSFILVRQKLVGGELLPEEICADQDTLFCRFNTEVEKLLKEPNIIFYRDRAFKFAEERIWEITPNIILGIPKFILNLFILVFVMFYSLKDSGRVFTRIGNMLPLKKSHKNKIFKKINDVNHAIVYGHVITGLIQGAIGTLGFYAFGVTSPLVLGIIMTMAALIPLVGTAFIWVPVSLIMILNALANGSTVEFWNGIGLFLYGALIISTIDNIIRPRITSVKAKVNPVIILIGLLGGLALFGIVGIIVGPLILALTTTFVEIYEKEKHEITG